ncbi:MAG: class I SAM-dependent methyltransferase [Acidobacteria bacterium]|nr:class I SAM-dependent methyltransferase [Acidobacteriota bacterium]
MAMKQAWNKHIRRLPVLPAVYHYWRILRNIWRLRSEMAVGNERRTVPLSLRAVASLAKFVQLSSQIPGWTRGEEAMALALTSYALPERATIVGIGAFLGSSTVLLAGARKLRNSGKVHAVDPFDASGDSFSAPIYRQIQQSLGVSLREVFRRNLESVGLSDWVEVCVGNDIEVAKGWKTPVDLLFLDADQSYEAVQATYRNWSPFLKVGGILAVHNSRQGIEYAESHDGSARLVSETIHPPHYQFIRCIGTTTFALKMSDHGV